MCHPCAPIDRPLPPPVTGGLGEATSTPKPAPGSVVVDQPKEGGESQPQPHEIPAGMPRVRHSLFRPGMWGQFTIQKQVMIMAAGMAAAAWAVFSKVKLKTAVLPVTTTPLRPGQDPA